MGGQQKIAKVSKNAQKSTNIGMVLSKERKSLSNTKQTF
jgi:hypothetical protein